MSVVQSHLVGIKISGIIFYDGVGEGGSIKSQGHIEGGKGLLFMT